MSGFERIKEEKKAKIREAAFKLFTENGYKNVKIADIARAAGVSQVTIYNHFESKEILFRDLMMRFMEETYDNCWQVLESDKSFKEKLEFIFVETMKSSKLFNPELMHHILYDDPILLEKMQKYEEKKGYPLIFQLIEEGKKAGEVNQNFSPKAILFFLNMLADASRKHPDVFIGGDRLPFIEDIFHLMFYGLLGKPKD